jgi:hypothetical protein
MLASDVASNPGRAMDALTLAQIAANRQVMATDVRMFDVGWNNTFAEFKNEQNNYVPVH